MTVELDRRAVLIHRTAVRGLPGTTSGGELEVVAGGPQDTPAGSASLGLRRRTGTGGPAPPGADPGAVRARAPHRHQRADLPVMRAALRTRDNEASRSWLGGTATS
jgi:hypothetical protein